MKGFSRMQVLGFVVGAAVALGILQLVGMWVGARVLPRPDNVNNGTLAPCPSSPNCVSTEADDELHGIEPISYTGDMADARTQLMTVLERLPKTQIITERDDYIYMESRSPMIGFVDDVEFVFDDAEKVIRFRSAARMGYGDLGKNRERMEIIRQQFLDEQANVVSRRDDRMVV